MGRFCVILGAFGSVLDARVLASDSAVFSGSTPIVDITSSSLTEILDGDIMLTRDQFDLCRVESWLFEEGQISGDACYEEEVSSKAAD
jgi:hypothetical protein